MIISLGRRLPGASSDLPGSRNGSGRPVRGCQPDADRLPDSWIPPAALLPYLVLLPMGFAEPGRSPGLLVSSYLTVSPLPRPVAEAQARGGLFSVALSLSGHDRDSDGGRYPPPHPVESGLSSAACPRLAGDRSIALSISPNHHGAAAIIAPATNSTPIIRGFPPANKRGCPPASRLRCT